MRCLALGRAGWPADHGLWQSGAGDGRSGASPALRFLAPGLACGVPAFLDIAAPWVLGGARVHPSAETMVGEVVRIVVQRLSAPWDSTCCPGTVSYTHLTLPTTPYV